MAKIEWTNEEGAIKMKVISALLSVMLILTGFLIGEPEPAKPVETVTDSLYVGDFGDTGLPAQADRFCRAQMGADEALSLCLIGVENQKIMLGDLLSNKEYEKIYLSLKLEEESQEDYWAVLNLVRQTQPQASIYLLGKENAEFFRRISDGRNIFYQETL